MGLIHPQDDRYVTRARGGGARAGWVREMSSRDVHAILGRFDRERTSADLTDRQEWLYDQCVAELEYRRRRARPIWSSCSCRYCIPPFTDGDVDAASTPLSPG